MQSLIWLIGGGGAMLLGAAGPLLWRWWQAPEAADRAPAREVLRDDALEDDRARAELLDLLPHPVLVLRRGGALLHANTSARAQLGDSLAFLLRHPLLNDAVRNLPAAEIRSITLAVDVPVRRLLRIVMRADHQLIMLSLMDHTEKEAIERMRSDFVAYASHELRTPLASLIGFIDTLLGPAADDPPAQRRFLAIMADQAARMRRLIDNLLTLSRIQMTEHDRPRDKVVLAPLVRRIADTYEPQCRSANIVMTVDVDEALPDVVGDADQLAQVLHNLLDNALKYTAQAQRTGHIVLSARLAGDARTPAHEGVVVAVQDDGPGVSAKHIPRLTERFYRVDGAAAGKAGSGLGLSIVKHIIGRHGGRLTIDSAIGKGSCFSVWLPASSS